MKLNGILTATVTPFDQHGRVDHELLSRIIAHQLECGVAGFAPLGSTGESYALTETERSRVLETFRTTVAGQGLLVGGANGSNTRDVITAVKQVRDAGYGAALVAPPYYAVPAQGELLKHYEAVLEAVPDIELVLYNYPARVGVEIGHEVLAGLADHPRVIAIKESSGEIRRAIEIGTRYAGKIDLCCGSDDVALDFFIWGATSWISAPANIITKEVVAFHRHISNGRVAEAKAISARIYPLMNDLESGRFIQKVKYGCELQGFPVGPGRMPLQPLSEGEKAAVERELELATQ